MCTSHFLTLAPTVQSTVWENISHKAVMEGIQHRDEKLRTLKANMLRSDLERLQGTMAQLPQAAVPAVQAVVTQLQRDLKERGQAARRL